MSIMYGDSNAKLYLGDTLLSRIPEFKGYIGNPYGISAPRAGRNLDPTKSYDIVCCFWWGEGHTATSDSDAAFGTLEDNHYYAYPSLEIRLSTGIWYGLSSNGREWDVISKTVSMSFTQNSYNYIKLSHNSETHTITVSYSTDGETWTIIDTNDISGVTLLTTSDRFCFGGNAVQDRLRLLPEDDYHICIEKCKIISDGEVLFGYED